MKRRAFLVYAVVTSIVEMAVLLAVLLWVLPSVGVIVPPAFTAAMVSVLAATSIVLTHLNLKAIARRPIRSPDVGVRAIVVRSLAPKGYVRVGNELWPALCETASGERGREVAVVRMEGLRLIVAPGDHPEASS